MVDFPGSRRRHPRWRHRGAIGAAMAIGIVSMLGMAALATEGGVWISSRRDAQNAADAGAYAGLVRLSLSGSQAAVAAGTEAIRLNGFTQTGAMASAGDTRVVVEVGFWGGGAFTTPAPQGSSANAVRTSIERVQRMGFARLISQTAPVAWGGAIAVLEVGGPACTLSIPPSSPTSQVAGRTNIAGSTTVNAPNCLVVSNGLERKSINIQGSAVNSVNVAGLRASGQCYNCEDVPSASVPGGYVSGAPTTPNPYAYLDAWSMPSFSNADCVAPLYVNATGQEVSNQNQATTIYLANYNPTPAAGVNYAINYTRSNGQARTFSIAQSNYVATCTNISISGQNLVLKPGTYFFNNSSLSMSNGTISCDGCVAGGAGITLVFTGSNANNVGNLQISGGDFTLIAPGIGSGDPGVFDGTVIYRDDLGRTSNSANDNMLITGNATSTIFGAIYAPTAPVTLLGTNGMNQTTAGNCIAVVAAEITFSGNSGANIDACEANGTRVARTRYVRFVQ